MRPGRLLVPVLVALCLTVIPVPLFGAKFARVDFVAKAVVHAEEGTLRSIAGKYFTGQIGELRKQIEAEFIDDNVEFEGEGSPHSFDFARNYYSLLFVADKPGAPKGEMVRVLLYPSGKITRYTGAGLPSTEFGDAVLAEDSVFYELFITGEPTDTVRSIYSYVEVESPLHAQLLKAFKLIDLGAVAGKLAGVPESFSLIRGKEPVFVHISKVTVPGVRGTLTIESTLNPPTDKSQTSGDAAQTADQPLTNKTIYTVTPLERWSVGTIAAGMLWRGGDARAKLNSGVVQEDPLDGTVTIVGFYWHPRPFFSGAVKPSGAERIAVLSGYVATPAPGVALGLSWLAFRGLTINVGGTAMVVDTAKSSTQLKRGHTTAGFIGLGYDFQ